MSRIKFGFLGGDYRYRILFDMLKEDGYDVKAYFSRDEIRGIDLKNNSFNKFDELMRGIDVLILPIPCSKDKKTVFMPNDADTQIQFDRLFGLMEENNVNVMFGGVIPNEVKIQAHEKDIKCCDFFEQESVAVLNAIPTAEGAIQSAMQESEDCIFASSVLVLGYGRCGKVLANMLKGIGANVSVSYRNERDEAYIRAYGYRGVSLGSLEGILGEFDFIFNTIPAKILDRNLLKNVKRRAVIIDIAQAPGGVDYSFARDRNLRALHCPGLPGRVAPFMAAKILKEAVLNICLSHLM